MEILAKIFASFILIGLLFGQLFLYSLWNWLMFAGITFLLGRYLRISGIVISHLIIAFAVFWFDIEYKANYPEMDMIFFFRKGFLFGLCL